MSLTPMPSLKSSVGSKSGDLHLAAGSTGEDGFCYFLDERSRALRSSWISRLRLPPLPLPPAGRPPSLPPPAAPADLPCTTPSTGGGVLGHKHTVSTDESRTRTSISCLNSGFLVRRYLNLFTKKPPPTLPLAHVVSGFGPYQVRTRRALSRRAEGNPRCDGGGKEALGKPDYENNSNFPLFQRMARLGQDRRGGEEDEERREIGFYKGWHQKSWNCEENLNRNNTSFLSQRRVPDGRNGVHLSPFFQFRPPLESGYLDDSRAGGCREMARDKGLFGPPVGELSAKFVDADPTSSSQKLSHMMPESNANICSPLTRPHFTPRDLINECTSQRAYEQHLSVDPWHATSSVQHAARTRGVACHDDTAPRRTFCGPHVLQHGMTPCHLERHAPACTNEPEEPFSFWNMGRFKRKNTISSVSPTIALTSSISKKRNPNVDDFLPSKSRKLGSED